MPSSGYSRSPRLTKGLLIKLEQSFFEPIPQAIVFQYNPETLTRSFDIHNSNTASQNSDENSADQTQPKDPGESFDLELILDASDDLEEPEKHPETVLTGVADRIAALEMLLYPVESESAKQKENGACMNKKVPIILFYWGRGRILPVRITSMSVEEQLFSPSLHPTRAKVSVGLSVMLEEDIEGDSTAASIAKGAYFYTLGQKVALANANLANTAESTPGLLPF